MLRCCLKALEKRAPSDSLKRKNKKGICGIWSRIWMLPLVFEETVQRGLAYTRASTAAEWRDGVQRGAQRARAAILQQSSQCIRRRTNQCGGEPVPGPPSAANPHDEPLPSPQPPIFVEFMIFWCCRRVLSWQ